MAFQKGHIDFVSSKSRKIAGKKISKALKGKECPGRKLSESHKKNIGLSHKGKPLLKNRGAKNPNWKGGEIKSGNRWFVKKRNHPFADKNSYVRRSHLVMEKYLGRYLTSGEIIHHIDSNTLNDNIKNLMLFSNNQKHLKYHYKTRQIDNLGRFKPNLPANQDSKEQ